MTRPISLHGRTARTGGRSMSWMLLLLLGTGGLAAGIARYGVQRSSARTEERQLGVEQERRSSATTVGMLSQRMDVAGGSVAAPSSVYDRATLLRMGRAYHDGKNNIDFNEEQMLKEIAKSGPQAFALIKAELSSMEALEQLAAGTRFNQERPTAVLDRMSLIDLTEGFLEHSFEPGIQAMAVDVLTSTAKRQIPRDSTDVIQRELLGEKFDSLSALTRRRRDLALQIFAGLESAREKRLMLPALMLGLMDTGMKQDEIEKLLKPYEAATL